MLRREYVVARRADVRAARRRLDAAAQAARRDRDGDRDRARRAPRASSRTCATRSANYNAMTVDGAVEADADDPLAATSSTTATSTGIDTRDRRAARVLPAGREVAHDAQPLDDWKTYLRWHLAAHVRRARPAARFDAENFHFYGTILNGTAGAAPALEAHARRGGGLPRRRARPALRASSTSRRAPRQRYEKLTDEIFAAFRERIQKLDWMSEATKAARAAASSTSVTKKVGYPDKWRDYSSYDVDRESFLGERACAATSGGATTTSPSSTSRSTAPSGT